MTERSKIEKKSKIPTNKEKSKAEKDLDKKLKDTFPASDSTAEY